MLHSPIPPSGRNPIYTFIQRNLSDPVSILSQWANDKLVSKDETLSLSSSYCSDYTYPSVPTDAGVYVWSVGEKGKQYIGSTINQYARFCDHVSCFTGDGSKKGCLMHKWVLETNSLHLCHWHSVYNCFNFYLEFIKQNPTYELSPQEIWALKCLTEFFPRILEQSLLSQKSFKGWNKQDKVQFYFNARSEGLTTKKQITRDPKYLLVDAQTKKMFSENPLFLWSSGRCYRY
jgi:hypothetical protein